MKKPTVLLTLLGALSIAAPSLWARPSAPAPSAPVAQASEQKKQPQWKSREEYDAYMAFAKEKDASKRVPLIEAFLEKYSNSDFKGNALAFLMQTYQQLNDTSKAIETARKALQADPDSLDALGYLSFTFPYTFKASSPNAASELSQAKEEAQHGLDLLQKLQKPANVTDAQFQAYVKPKRASFNLVLGFIALQQKDYAAAVAPLKAAAEDGPKNPTVYSLLGHAYYNSKPPDINNAIWFLARAAALAQSSQNGNASAYEKDYSQVYESRRKSDCGEKEVLAEAATSTDPPGGFSVSPPPTHQATGNKNVDAFFQNIEDPLLVGCDAAQKAWQQLKGQPLALVGTVDSVQPGSDPGTTLVNVDLTPESKNQQGVYDIQLQDSSQPDSKLLRAGDPVSFQGTLSAFTTNPNFSVTLYDAKINGDVLKMASERQKAEEQEKKSRKKTGGRARRR
jgi:tetratricopeptide (TPR) repeat protein